jgi:hypothetical protein
MDYEDKIRRLQQFAADARMRSIYDAYASALGLRGPLPGAKPGTPPSPPKKIEAVPLDEIKGALSKGDHSRIMEFLK